MDWRQPARRVKHGLFVSTKRARRAYVELRDIAFSGYDQVRPYRFDVDDHRNSRGELPRMYFLHREPPPGTALDWPVPRVIYVLWTGTNPLSTNRRRGLESLEKMNPDVPVVLVTPDNLSDYVLPDAPLHPAYEHLSLNHRSDYLRAYLMHHHGGGYSDVKVCRSSWEPAFEQIDGSPDLWTVGYPEVGSDRCGGRDPRLGHDIRRHFSSLMGFGAFICRPQTPLTAEWLREVERRLDYYAGELSENPGDEYGDAPGYPIDWIELGIDIMGPLQLKYLNHIGQNPCILPELMDHR